MKAFPHLRGPGRKPGASSYTRKHLSPLLSAFRDLLLKVHHCTRYPYTATQLHARRVLLPGLTTRSLFSSTCLFAHSVRPCLLASEIVKAIEWHRLILDESHQGTADKKNNIVQHIKALTVKNKWLLTGTPVGGRVSALQGPLSMIGFDFDWFGAHSHNPLYSRRGLEMLLRRCACRHVADGAVARSVAGGTGEQNLVLDALVQRTVNVELDPRERAEYERVQVRPTRCWGLGFRVRV